LALLAPPLGAVELLAAGIVWPATSGSVSGLWVVVLLPYALVFSFVALVMTVPAGIAWAIVARAVPDGAVNALRMPAPFDRLGLRHALLAAVIVIAALELALRRGAP
jgi:hypothetical protein